MTTHTLAHLASASKHLLALADALHQELPGEATPMRRLLFTQLQDDALALAEQLDDILDGELRQ